MTGFPTITFSEEEQAGKIATESTLGSSAELFGNNGCLLLKNILAPDVVGKMRDFYLETNKRYFSNDSSTDALDVGHRRKMISVEMTGPFNSPDLYANPLLLPVLNQLLGAKIILGSLGSVAAMPGSEQQHIHFDHPHLFADAEIDDIIDKFPAFAITVIIPLVDVTEENGPTRMWPGSHLVARSRKPEIEKLWDYVDPIAQAGDALLFDYRLLHGGMPNNSDEVRPIMYLVYYRSWFRDIVNYYKQRPLLMNPEQYQQVPEEHRYLFSWLMEDKWSTYRGEPLRG